jgi:hypothetical protein
VIFVHGLRVAVEHLRLACVEEEIENRVAHLVYLYIK